MAGLAQRIAMILAALALPSVLIWSSVRTFQSLSDLRTGYLRNEAAGVASRLETLVPGQDAAAVLDEEIGPSLVGVQVFQREASASDPDLAPIWNGRELYRTERLTQNGLHVYRAFIPFHQNGRMQIARIDLDEKLADALLTPARQNVALASLAGLAITLLGIYAVWSVRRRAEMERRQIKLEGLARLGEMSAVLAHEIRNPLGTVKGFLQLAQEKNGPETASLLDPALEEVHRLERLVTGLLLYGKSPEPSIRDVRWSDIAPLLGIDSRVTVEPSDCTVRADPDFLKQILINLVRNATESGAAHVQVGAMRAGSTVKIAIEDDGPGIPESKLAKAFEPFFTTKSSGSGLGLAIAKKLAESMGGSLALTPRNPHGTVAVLSLPNGTHTHR